MQFEMQQLLQEPFIIRRVTYDATFVSSLPLMVVAVEMG
jgi:hypothetical protein